MEPRGVLEQDDRVGMVNEGENEWEKVASGPDPRLFPKWESLKNKSEISGVFLRPEKNHKIHHKSPRFHHKFTIKKPSFTMHFFKNPLQKHQNTTKQKTTSKLRGVGGCEVVDLVDVGDGFDEAGLFGVGSFAFDAGVDVLDAVDAEGAGWDFGGVGEAGGGQEDNVAGFR